MGLQDRADRYTYLPAIGIVIAFVWTLRDLTAAWHSRSLILAPVAVAVVLALAALSYAQTKH